jgi:hypothetical protein
MEALTGISNGGSSPSFPRTTPLSRTPRARHFFFFATDPKGLPLFVALGDLLTMRSHTPVHV